MSKTALLNPGAIQQNIAARLISQQQTTTSFSRSIINPSIEGESNQEVLSNLDNVIMCLIKYYVFCNQFKKNKQKKILNENIRVRKWKIYIWVKKLG